MKRSGIALARAVEERVMITKHGLRAAQRQTRMVCLILWVMSVMCAALLLPLVTGPVMAEDDCGEQGITVRNATMLDLWCKKNDGACSIWVHEHLFTIKQGESIKIFSDMNCQTLYCTNNPAYNDYQSADTNGDCFANMFPDCGLADR